MDKIKEKIGKFWGVVKESKLNMSMFIAGVIAFILFIAVICVICFRGEGVTNEMPVEETTTEAKKEEEKTTEEKTEAIEDEEVIFSTEINENETGKVVTNAKVMKAKATIKDSWVDDGEYFIQYNIDMTNISEKDIKGWAAVITLESPGEVIDEWNFDFSSSKSRKIKVCPKGLTVSVDDDKYVSGGFVIKGSKYVMIDYITVYVGDSVETIKNNDKNIYEPKPEEKTTKVETATEKETQKDEEETTTVRETATEKETQTEETTKENTETETTTEKETETSTMQEETTTPAGEEETTTEDISEPSGEDSENQ